MVLSSDLHQLTEARHQMCHPLSGRYDIVILSVDLTNEGSVWFDQ
jgi:hypothetical protein